MARILILEDDKETAEYVADGLKELGHLVEVCSSGENALFIASEFRFDVAILDRMTPGLDGLTVLRELRSAGVETSIVVLTALSDIEDRVEALEAGADDYLTKPFAFSELTARVAALLRRPRVVRSEPKTLEAGSVSVDLDRRIVTVGGASIDLQPQEFRLLTLFLEHKGGVVDRSQIAESLWPGDSDHRRHGVESSVNRLRRTLAKAGCLHPVIETVRGRGYVLQ